MEREREEERERERKRERERERERQQEREREVARIRREQDARRRQQTHDQHRANVEKAREEMRECPRCSTAITGDTEAHAGHGYLELIRRGAKTRAMVMEETGVDVWVEVIEIQLRAAVIEQGFCAVCMTPLETQMMCLSERIDAERNRLQELRQERACDRRKRFDRDFSEAKSFGLQFSKCDSWQPETCDARPGNIVALALIYWVLNFVVFASWWAQIDGIGVIILACRANSDSTWNAEAARDDQTAGVLARKNVSPCHGSGRNGRLNLRRQRSLCRCAPNGG